MVSVIPRARPGECRLRRALVSLVAVLPLALAAALGGPGAVRAQAPPEPARAATTGLGEVYDAVVEQTMKHFWDKERIAAVDWSKLAAAARPGVVEAPSLEEAARRINELLARLETSHTAFLTPDDVDYYVLLAVLGRADLPQDEYDARFWGAGVTYAGIGHFSVRIDGHDFVDLVMEGSPADRAGLKVGDEILAVDGAPYHPIRSFRGKVGHAAVLTIRRTRDGAPEELRIQVMSIAPVYAFGEATRASARVVERDGKRIGYVHAWASLSESVRALSGALSKLMTPPRSASGPVPTAATDLDGLIIDMRGKVGGYLHIAKEYLDLVAPRGPYWRERGGRTWESMAGAGRRRTAVLIDHHTRSTAELFVHAYKHEREGPLIGTRTAGAVSSGRTFAMPGANLLYLATTGLEMMDGKVLEGTGVAPDIEVARPVPYAQGADPVLEAAVAYLAGRAAPRDQSEPAVPSGSN
jgi:carboxyl-terminal processing protease